MRCEVRQESDEMVCRCGLRWDVSDPAPPVCVSPPRTNTYPAPTPADAMPRLPTQIAERRYRVVNTPVELPVDVARRMADVFALWMQACEPGKEKSQPERAMQAAYRIFLKSLVQ